MQPAEQAEREKQQPEKKSKKPMQQLINQETPKQERKEILPKSYVVAVRLAFFNAFLNLSASVSFRVGVVAGMGNGSAVVLVVMGGFGE